MKARSVSPEALGITAFGSAPSLYRAPPRLSAPNLTLVDLDLDLDLTRESRELGIDHGAVELVQ